MTEMPPTPVVESDPPPDLCARCGDRLDEGRVAVLDRWICATCAEEPKGDYIRTWRKELEEHGNVVQKLLGPVSVGFALLGLAITSTLIVEALSMKRVPIAATRSIMVKAFPPLIAWLTVAVLIWRRQAYARFAAIPILPAAFLWPLLIERPPNTAALVIALVIMAVPSAALFSPSYRLALGLEVSDEELDANVQRAKFNPEASAAFALGVASLIPWCGALAIAGIPAAIVGMRKVDETAWPPIRLGRSARIGLALNILGLLETAGLFAFEYGFRAG